RDGGRVVGAEAPFRFTVDLESGVVLAAEDADALHSRGEDAGSGPTPDASPRALVSGVIDRVEVYPAGAGEHDAARGQKWERMSAAGERVVVVDLKTGKYEPDTEAKVREHAQLAAYQIAVQEGLLEGAPA